MSEKLLTDADVRPYTGQDVLYREKGVTALDVQRAADTLLRRGQKPSIAAVREELGSGSPNTLGPLLEKYWKGLGTRLPAGPESLERVPESLARMTEALWLRSLDEARERTKTSQIGMTNSPKTMAALEGKVTELSAALAESRARASELEVQLLTSLRDRLELRDQVRQLMALLKAEKELRAQEQGTAGLRQREIESTRAELLALKRRRLSPHPGQRAARKSTSTKGKNRRAETRVTRPSASARIPSKQVRATVAKRGRR